MKCLRVLVTATVLFCAAQAEAALSFVGTPTTAASTPSTAVSVNKPSDVASGDRAYVLVHSNSETVTLADNNGSTPFSDGGTITPAGGGGSRIFVRYRTLTGAEDGAFDFTLSSNQRWTAIAWALRGVHASDIFDVSPALGNSYDDDLGSQSSSRVCPGVTTGVDNTLVFAVAGNDGTGNGTFTGFPGGWTVVATENTQQPMSAYYKTMASAGGTGDATFTVSVVGNGLSVAVFSIPPSVASGHRPRKTLLGVGN